MKDALREKGAIFPDRECRYNTGVEAWEGKGTDMQGKKGNHPACKPGFEEFTSPVGEKYGLFQGSPKVSKLKAHVCRGNKETGCSSIQARLLIT